MARKKRIVLAALALLGTVSVLAATPAAATTTGTPSVRAACATGWGSTDKTGTATTTASLTNVRTGTHDCYDRMVVDVPGAGTGLGYSVRYVDRLYQDGTGRPIAVGGGAVIEVRVQAPAYDPQTGRPTYPGRVAQPLPGVDLTGYPTFKDTRFAGSFEGDTQLGLGVRARLPFRVLVLDDRIVVDVAHSWSAAR
ncbi:hypothetical protein AB0D49_23735 [Streptomyces sp. NPDC048290]|uniref:AMIN-like domain-containing (lipo)protein n=1 Tax=Streptomyces sp. NPDC048290 TaxID=3155811 RepID=UPI00343AA5ED